MGSGSPYRWTAWPVGWLSTVTHAPEPLGRGPDTALVVGDDLAADVGGAHAVGAAAVLVRSGKGDRPQPGAEAEPDAVMDSIAGLPGLLQG